MPLKFRVQVFCLSVEKRNLQKEMIDFFDFLNFGINHFCKEIWTEQLNFHRNENGIFFFTTIYAVDKFEIFYKTQS